MTGIIAVFGVVLAANIATAASHGAALVNLVGPMQSAGYTPTEQEPPVRVVLVPTLDRPDAKALIVRAGEGRPLDIVYVTSRTSPSELAQAIAVLVRARERSGARGRGEARAYIGAVQDRDTPNTRFADDVLRRLMTTKERPVKGHGQARYVIVPIVPHSPS
jgi:hypothetical protein